MLSKIFVMFMVINCNSVNDNRRTIDTGTIVVLCLLGVFIGYTVYKSEKEERCRETLKAVVIAGSAAGVVLATSDHLNSLNRSVLNVPASRMIAN